MSRITHGQYDLLERAIASGRRIVLSRRGTEYIVVPTALRSVAGRDVLDARHPTTGEPLVLFLDELEGIEGGL